MFLRELVFAIGKDWFFLAGSKFLRFAGSRVMILELQHFRFSFEYIHSKSVLANTDVKTR